MQFTEQTGPAIVTVTAYTPGELTVRTPDTPRHTLTGSAILVPERLVEGWPPQSLAALRAEHFAMALELRPQLLLLGSGAEFRFPPAEVLAPLAAAGVGFEVMDTGAACRTYNILANEGRLVAAALLIR